MTHPVDTDFRGVKGYLPARVHDVLGDTSAPPWRWLGSSEAPQGSLRQGLRKPGPSLIRSRIKSPARRELAHFLQPAGGRHVHSETAGGVAIVARRCKWE